MPYVVTQSCCGDASCVLACPVNCIHPAPGEPGFAEAEMVYVDPQACVDCGACATACPVDAVKPHTKLTDTELPFVQLNARYFEVNPHSDRTPLASVPPKRHVTTPLRVAVVGAGPAGLYVADELLKHAGVTVDVFDRLPTPYGLVRYGVAPDHRSTKRITRLFHAIEEQPGFGYRLGTEVGTDISHDELRRQYGVVVYSVGATHDRRLGIEGEDLPGSASATEFVAWYNGHPDQPEAPIPLDSERAVVIGNGNVALYVARMLTIDPLDSLTSKVREVVVLGRRGPADAAFTIPELIGLAGLTDVDVVVDSPVEVTSDKTAQLARLAARPTAPGKRWIVLRFHTAPVRILGADHVTGLEVTGGEVIATDVVLRAIGYRARPVEGLPFDDVTGTVPNDRGRVSPGVYVAGWVKRGPNGFIGTNKACAEETVEQIFDDLDAGLLADARLDNVPPVSRPARDNRPDGRSARWDQHKAERRAVILEAAVVVLERNPPGAELHVQQIADEAGVGRTVVYRHFADKTELDGAIRARVLELLQTQVLSAVELTGSIEQIISRIVASYVEWADAHPSLHRFGERRGADRELESMLAVIGGRVSELIEMAAALFHVTLTDDERSALPPLTSGLIGWVFASVHHWLARPVREPGKDAMVDLLSRSIWYLLDGHVRSHGLELDPTQPIELLLSPT